MPNTLSISALCAIGCLAVAVALHRSLQRPWAVAPLAAVLGLLPREDAQRVLDRPEQPLGIAPNQVGVITARRTRFLGKLLPKDAVHGAVCDGIHALVVKRQGDPVILHEVSNQFRADIDPRAHKAY